MQLDKLYSRGRGGIIMLANGTTFNDKNSLKWIYNLIDNAHDFFVLKNLNGNIIYINSRLLEYLGYVHDDIDNDYKEFFYNVLQYKEHGPLEDGLVIELKTRYLEKRTFTIKYSPVTNNYGEKIAFLGFVRPKNYCKNKSEQCFNVFKNYIDVMEFTEEGVVVIDNKSNIIYANHKVCDIFHIKYSKFITKKFIDILKNYIEDINEMNLYKGIKLKIRSKESSEERIILIKYGDVNTDCWYSVFVKDITEDIKYNGLIEQAEKYNVLGEITASTIHEIKNSLTSVRGFIQLLQIKHKESESYYETIMDEVNRALNLMKSYLGIIRNSEPSETEDIDINAIINQYMLLFEAEAAHKKIKFKKIFSDLPMIKIDKNHIKQLILNIVQNSLQAIEEDGEIILTTKYLKNKNKIVIRFADNGGGIDKETLKKITKPLFTTKKDGTGLGLAVCRNILEIYEGDMKILSKKGKGTIVKLFLNVK